MSVGQVFFDQKHVANITVDGLTRLHVEQMSVGQEVFDQEMLGQHSSFLVGETLC
jgi:hypothetical protein